MSLGFFIFFPIVTMVYFLLPHRFRWVWLLIASCLFYMAFIPAYILVLFGLIVVDYTTALLIERSEGTRRTHWLLVSITGMVGTLFIFKYFNFFNANLAVLATFLDWNYPVAFLSLALPLGLSFHTFQSLSYVIEVYRGKQKAERHLGIYALYVMFYPQLVAGPIERPQQLLPQLHTPHHFDYERVKLGLVRMAWGFFKKMVVADHLALVVDRVFGQPTLYDGPGLLIAAVFFTFQLYFDFSGYCDIALGAAQVMGFSLMENFNRPFASKTMAEWWRRWHISLSSWFRDYFYYPLTLSQKRLTQAKIYAVTLTTFLVTGFWHGANWTFGIFGALHGTYIVFGAMTQKVRAQLAGDIGLSRLPRLHRALQALVIFVCATLACIFFRAQTVTDGWYMTTHIASDLPKLFSPSVLHAAISAVSSSTTSFALSVIFTVGILAFEHFGREKGVTFFITSRPWLLRWGIYWAMLFLIVILSQNTSSQFIYFQF